MRVITIAAAAVAALSILSVQSPALAQPAAAAPPRPAPYGAVITREQAMRAAAAAAAEARRRNVSVAIAVAGPTGDIVFFEHMDGAVYATDDLAPLKARNAARYRMPTSNFVTMQKNGQSFPDVFVGAGGMPLVVDGKTVGAIAVSGGADDPVAQAGVDALK